MHVIDAIFTLKTFAEKEARTHNVVVAAMGHDSEIITVRSNEHLTRDMYRFYKAGAGIFDEDELMLCQLYIGGKKVDTLVRHATRG